MYFKVAYPHCVNILWKTFLISFGIDIEGLHLRPYVTGTMLDLLETGYTQTDFLLFKVPVSSDHLYHQS
jgi:hypothetical protein